MLGRCLVRSLVNFYVLISGPIAMLQWLLSRVLTSLVRRRPKVTRWLMSLALPWPSWSSSESGLKTDTDVPVLWLSLTMVVQSLRGEMFRMLVATRSAALSTMLLMVAQEEVFLYF